MPPILSRILEHFHDLEHLHIVRNDKKSLCDAEKSFPGSSHSGSLNIFWSVEISSLINVLTVTLDHYK